MRATIGILAHNEEQNIHRTIASLLEQSVFFSESEVQIDQWTIIVVPNGCSDKTADVAKNSLEERVGALHLQNIEYQVESLARPGKSNAWNELIHKIAPLDTDIFVMIDADIEFGHKDTISNSIHLLLANDNVRVVVDLPLKDFVRKARLTMIERISASMSKSSIEGPAAIAGSFYCGRADALKQVWMPLDISVEDGFLYAMVITDNFRQGPDTSRVVRAEDASHYFEGLTNLRSIVRHEVRLLIGTHLNCELCWNSLLFLTNPEGSGAGTLIRDLNNSRPKWYVEMMSNYISNLGYWPIPFKTMFRRFSGSSRESLGTVAKKLPRRLIGVAFDAIVWWEANRVLRSGRGIGYW